jgi:hypothetical protein
MIIFNEEGLRCSERVSKFQQLLVAKSEARVKVIETPILISCVTFGRRA